MEAKCKGKTKFKTYKEAKKVNEFRPKFRVKWGKFKKTYPPRLSIYKCPYCGFWHRGHNQKVPQ